MSYGPAPLPQGAPVLHVDTGLLSCAFSQHPRGLMGVSPPGPFLRVDTLLLRSLVGASRWLLSSSVSMRFFLVGLPLGVAGLLNSLTRFLLRVRKRSCTQRQNLGAKYILYLSFVFDLFIFNFTEYLYLTY